MPKKQALSQEEISKQKREKTAQQWNPIADIENSIVYRKDGYILGALRIQPENIDLLSDAEKRRRIDSLTEQLNGVNEGLQIFCIGRPVDLNNYLEWLQEKAKMEQDFVRKSVLKGYIQQASQLATSGETMERRFYIIISRPYENKGEVELRTRLNDLMINLSQAELTAHVCKDEELIDVYSLFASPIQASFEKTEYNKNLSTLLEY